MSNASPIGKLIVISGPSGVGKSTICKAVSACLNTGINISMTTRNKTAQDVEGKDYYFVTQERFKQAIENNELLEWAEVFGNYYGTPRGPVEANLANGEHVILEIDVNGAEQVHQNYARATLIFILPPDEATLLQRLRSRGRDDEDTIQKRFNEAQREIRQAHDCGAYDHFVVNEVLDEAVKKVIALIDS